MDTNKSAPAMIAGAVLIVGIVVAGVVTLALHGRDVAPLLTVVTLIVVPILGALGALKLGEIHQGQTTVQQQTNGNTTRLLDLVERLAAPSPPAPAAVAAQLSSTEPFAAGYVDGRGRPLDAAGNVIDLQRPKE